MKKILIAIAIATMTLSSGCITNTNNNNVMSFVPIMFTIAPIEIKPVYIQVDVNLKVDKSVTEACK